jgi:hypothetical protein
MKIEHRIRKFRRVVGALALSACSACHSSSAPTAAPAAAEAASVSVEPRRAPGRTPVSARLRGPAQAEAGRDIELTAVVERNTGADQPISIELLLPPGARLVSGRARELLPGGNGKLERTFVVHLDRLPDTEIELVATAGNQAFGARARGAYRYGRPEPRLLEPVRSPNDLMYGGRNLGRPIELKPKGQ